MAGGNILDMQDLGDGRYQATMANGATPIFTGDAGRQAYERLRKQEKEGATAGLGRDALKGAVSGLGGAIPGIGPVAAAAASRYLDKNETATDAPTPVPGAEPAKERQAIASSAQSPAPVAAPAGAPPPQPGQPPPAAGPPPNGALPYAVEGIDPVTQKKIVGPGVMVNGQMFVDRGPGTKGSPGGITALGKQVQDERAVAEAKAKELEAKARQSEMQGVALAVDDVAKQQAYLQKREEEAVLAKQNADKEAADADNYVLDLRGRADAAIEEHANSRAPEESAQDKFFAGLGAALGAFGASLGKTPNFAAEYIQTLRNNKIRKWEAEVNIKGQRANNLLSRLKDATGDMKLAKAAAAVALDRQASVEAQQMALSTKTDQLRNAWETAANAAAANGVKSEQKMNEDARLAFLTNKMYNKPATAGTPGGLVLATQGAYSERQDQQANQANMALKQAEAQRAAAGGGPGGKPVPAEVKKQIGELDAAMAGLDRMDAEDKAAGAPYVLRTEGGLGASDYAKQLAGSAAAVGPGVARAIEGDAATKESMESAKRGLASGSAEQRAVSREAYRRQLIAKKQAILNSQ